MITLHNFHLEYTLDRYAEIPAGSSTTDVQAVCTETGQKMNGIAVGEVKTIVDPVPYIASAANINISSGGADVESDTDFAERIYLAPSAYSTAGPEDSYKYHARRFNPCHPTGCFGCSTDFLHSEYLPGVCNAAGHR